MKFVDARWCVMWMWFCRVKWTKQTKLTQLLFPMSPSELGSILLHCRDIETEHQTQYECEDSLLVVCQILLWDQEQISSTFYLWSIFQEVCRTVGKEWHCARLNLLHLLTDKLVQPTVTLSDSPQFDPSAQNIYSLEGATAWHKCLWICLGKKQS